MSGANTPMNNRANTAMNNRAKMALNRANALTALLKIENRLNNPKNRVNINDLKEIKTYGNDSLNAYKKQLIKKRLLQQMQNLQKKTALLKKRQVIKK